MCAREDYRTRELSRSTWPDFEALFIKYRGVAGGCWCTFDHGLPRWRKLSREERRKAKRDLVWRDDAHGILVSAGDTPVGWCQYGPQVELPRLDHVQVCQSAVGKPPEKLWRITCFLVDRGYRKRGVARVALKAALDSVRRKGGGVVEAYAVTAAKATPSRLWLGTQRMFAQEGFRTYAPMWEGFNVVMRRTLRPSRSASARTPRARKPTAKRRNRSQSPGRSVRSR